MSTKNSLCLLAALCCLASSAVTPASAQRSSEGGYYYSLNHPDMGTNVEHEQRYQSGDGYYGAMQLHTPRPGVYNLGVDVAGPLQQRQWASSELGWAGYFNKAKFLEQQNNLPEAEANLQYSVREEEILPDKKLAMFSELELGNVYVRMNRLSKAEHFYEDAIGHARSISPEIEVFALHQIVDNCRKERTADLLSRWTPQLAKNIEQTDAPPALARNAEYMNRVYQQLKLKWNPPSRDIANNIRLFVWVDGNGRISDLHVSNSSGDQQADEQATLAARRTKFGKLPPMYGALGAPVELAFHFLPLQVRPAPTLLQIRSSRLARKS